MKKKLLAGLVTGSLVLGLGCSAFAIPINSGFESGDLAGWASGGQSGVQSVITKTGSYAAWIGTVDFNGDDVNDITGDDGTSEYTNNWISQSIDVAGMSTLELWYNFYTWDYADWDAPGFEIQINNQSVLSMNAGDLDLTDDGNGLLDSTGWQQFSFDLTGYTNSTLDLLIYAGNTGDEEVQSWVYIDSSTLSPVPEPTTMLLFGTGLASLIGYKTRRKKKHS